jgi:hypothetical protein
MSVVAPPEPPQREELEALIREARARQRRRRMRYAAGLAAGSALALALWSAVPGGGSAGARSGGSPGPAVQPRACPPGNLGTIAFVRGGALELLNLHGCRVRTLVRSHVQAPIAMSPDGRWVSFRGGYASIRSGRVERVKGSITWAPHSDLLAVVTRRGGVNAAWAGGQLRTLLPAGWGAGGVVFSPDGQRVAVSRTAGHHEEIWLVDLATGSRQELFREPPREGAPLLLQGFSPDGHWLLFWKDMFASASLLADGVPLYALPVAGGTPRLITRNELLYSGFLTWCGNRLVYVLDHGGRWVATAAPPAWSSQVLLPAAGSTSWTSFGCRPGESGQLVVAAGPSSEDTPFGHEHRSLWLVDGTRAELLKATTPAPGATDEWPSWSADGRWLLFVRTKSLGGHGELYALNVSRGRLLGPIASVGHAGNYYGHYGWASQLSWHRS